MDRLAPFNTLLLWGASFYLLTHGVLPPTSSETEARELAEALRAALVAWVVASVGARARVVRAWAGRLLRASLLSAS